MKKLFLASGFLITLLVMQSQTFATPTPGSDQLAPSSTTSTLLKKTSAGAATKMGSGIIFPSIFFARNSWCDSRGFPTADLLVPLVNDVPGATGVVIAPGTYHIDAFWRASDQAWTRSQTFWVKVYINSAPGITPPTSQACSSYTGTNYLGEYSGATLSGHQECDVTVTTNSVPVVYYKGADASHNELCLNFSVSIKATQTPIAPAP